MYQWLDVSICFALIMIFDNPRWQHLYLPVLKDKMQRGFRFIWKWWVCSYEARKCNGYCTSPKKIHEQWKNRLLLKGQWILRCEWFWRYNNRTNKRFSHEAYLVWNVKIPEKGTDNFWLRLPIYFCWCIWSPMHKLKFFVPYIYESPNIIP